MNFFTHKFFFNKIVAIFTLFTFIPTFTEGFHLTQKPNSLISLKMVDPNVNVISKYKSFFDKENINEVINKINSHQLSDIYINKNFPELVAVDVPIDSEPLSYQNFHITSDLNPLLAQQVVNKAFENNVLVHVVDFNDANQLIAFLSKIP